MIRLEYPFDEKKCRALHAGDTVSIYGVIRTGRDRFHKYFADGGKLGIDFKDGALFHCGPVVVKEGGAWKVMAAGPTTSVRENPYEPDFIARTGVRLIIGKGGMDEKTLAACKKHGAVYLQAVGGAAALTAQAVKRVEGVHFLKEFGAAEACWEFYVEDFRAVVAMDTHGVSLFARTLAHSSAVFKKLIAGLVICVGLGALAIQALSIPSLDRLALANGLARRGMYQEALVEYEALVGDGTIPAGELDFQLGETYRHLGRTNDAVNAYARVLEKAPESQWADYARLDKALLSAGAARTEALKALDRASAPVAIRQAAVYRLGEAAEAQKDMKIAAENYMRAAELAPTNELAHLARLKGATILSVSDNAVDRRRALSAYLELAFAKDRRFAEEAIFFAGLLGYREKRYADAAVMFRRLETDFPQSARIREAEMYAAWSFLLGGKYAEALRKAKMALRNEGSSREEALYVTAAALKALERRDEAVDAYGDLIRAFPNGRYTDRAWGERLFLYGEARKYTRVLDQLQERGDPPAEIADRVFNTGLDAAIATTNFPVALQFARRLSKSTASPYAPRALYLAGVLSSRLKDYKSAVADWTDLLARFPTSPFAPDALNSRALEEIRSRDYKAANHSFAELAKRFPDKAADATTLYWRGVAARGARDLPQAEKLFREALAAKPSAEFAREIRLELASVLQSRGREREAAGIFTDLLDTKAVERLPPSALAWLAETSITASNYPAALQAAGVLESRDADPSWNQIACTLAGYAHQAKGETDAAMADFKRALKNKAQTDAGARAALALGRIESELGGYNRAKTLLTEAVERSRADHLLPVRMRAYAALGMNEEARGEKDEALRYYMITGTLFDDPFIVPQAMARAIAILRSRARMKEANELESELKRRYPEWKGEE